MKHSIMRNVTIKFILWKGMRLKMKTFFSSTFVNEELLQQEGICYPIKLEYYKITNEIDPQEEKVKFGIKVVEKEYKKEGIKVNKQKIEEVSNDEEKIEELLKKLERNEVTPGGLEDVINEFVV